MRKINKDNNNGRGISVIDAEKQKVPLTVQSSNLVENLKV